MYKISPIINRTEKVRRLMATSKIFHKLYYQKEEWAIRGLAVNIVVDTIDNSTGKIWMFKPFDIDHHLPTIS